MHFIYSRYYRQCQFIPCILVYEGSIYVLAIFGYQSINWFWTFNLWTLNFYSWEGRKWV